MATITSNYQDVLDAVGRYYGTGSDEWLEFAKYHLHADNLAEMLRQVPGVDVHVNKAGDVIGYSLNGNVSMNDGGVSSSLVNSNTQTGTAAAGNTTTIKTLGNFTTDQQTGEVAPTNKIPKKTGGVAGAAEAVVGTVAAATIGASVGLTLGRTINNALYENNPTFWADLTDIPDGSEAQEEWKKITALYDEVDEDGKVTHFLNAIAGLGTNEKATAYVSEDAVAYYAWMLNRAGFFDTGGSPTFDFDDVVTGDKVGGTVITPEMASSIASNISFSGIVGEVEYASQHRIVGGFTTNAYVPTTWYTYKYTQSGVSYVTALWVSDSEPSGSPETSITTAEGAYLSSIYGKSSSNVTHDGVTKRVYYRAVSLRTTGSYPELPSDVPVSYFTYAALFGFAFGTSPSALPGVDTDPSATLPNTSGWTTPAATKQSLYNQYPELWNNAYQNDIIKPDGTTETINYLPIALPAGYTNGNPITVDNPTGQTNPTVDPSNPNVTDDLLRTIIAILTKPATTPATITDPSTDNPTNTDPNPPDTGGGATPPLVVPVGSASALWAVYNPTQAEVNSLGAWLWSNNFVDQLLKMFNDPMQAIIGLHKTFIPPITGGVQDIKVGYLNSGVSSLTVPVQYSSVDCGTIDCAEYFGNVFDYSPYTRIYLYLPFIGFKELEVAQVMRSRINVTYHGDAFTGTCLAEVAVNRDGESGGVLYTYSGDCAARYPLSHGSYMGIVNAIAGIGIGIGTALAGAPSVGIAGAVGMAQHARATVEHSGSFSGNSGAMGIKKPYLVVMRPQPAMANNYEHFTGQPSNSNVVLGSASGYVRVKECHVEDITTATDAEKQMIESALKTGVII